MQVQAISETNKTKNLSSSTNATSGSDFSSCLKTQTQSSSLSEIFNEASTTYAIPLNLLTSVAKQESNFNSNATSSCGAMGVMQLMPSTAKSLGVSDAYDAKQNIMGGAKYLSYLLGKYDGNVSYALAAYNAGSGNVAKYNGIPPFKETQNYVAKITGYMQAGVNVPDGAVTVSNTGASSSTSDTESFAGSTANSSNTSTVSSDGDTSTEESSTLDSIFSYDDYLKFLDIYLKNKSQDPLTSTQKEDDKNNATDYYAYQNIRYNNSVLNLMDQSKTV